MPLYNRGGGGGSALPEVEPGKLLGASDSGELTWMEPGSSLFKGAWQAGESLYFQDFAGPTIPPEFTVVPGDFGGGTVSKAIPPSYTLPSGLPSSLRIRITYGHAGLTASCNLNLAALGLTGITQMSYWWATTRNPWSTTWAKRMVNGVVLEESTADHAFKKVTQVINDASVVRWEIKGFGDSNTTTDIYLAGVEIIGAATPYKRGDFVTHDGKMWKSETDNNGTTPGAAGAAWSEALTLPLSSGTTAQRPSASTVGSGYQYFDTTLGKPIWSNGTGWADAMGTAV